ncbi:MAG: hypothetical protein ABSG36_01985 [Acidimicrobiales bacterium]|jgi:hypothetical protein
MTAAIARWFGQPVIGTAGLRWTRPASHMQRGVARSGLLYMSEKGLGFVPRRVDAFFGARAVSFEFDAVSDILLKPTLRKLRVTVVTEDGRDKFIVSDAVVVYSDLQSWRDR